MTRIGTTGDEPAVSRHTPPTFLHPTKITKHDYAVGLVAGNNALSVHVLSMPRAPIGGRDQREVGACAAGSLAVFAIVIDTTNEKGEFFGSDWIVNDVS
jgi:hypothetical protein